MARYVVRFLFSRDHPRSSTEPHRTDPRVSQKPWPLPSEPCDKISYSKCIVPNSMKRDDEEEEALWILSTKMTIHHSPLTTHHSPTTNNLSSQQRGSLERETHSLTLRTAYELGWWWFGARYSEERAQSRRQERRQILRTPQTYEQHQERYITDFSPFLGKGRFEWTPWAPLQMWPSTLLCTVRVARRLSKSYKRKESTSRSSMCQIIQVSS